MSLGEKQPVVIFKSVLYQRFDTCVLENCSYKRVCVVLKIMFSNRYWKHLTDDQHQFHQIVNFVRGKVKGRHDHHS